MSQQSSTTDAVVRCEHLTRRFADRVAVDNVGFEIGPGETYGLLGPNGSGKTTTISMIAGILRADRGQIEIEGTPVTTRAGSAKSRIGLVPQEIALYRDLSARENLRFFGRLQGLANPELGSRIDEVLEVVGLVDRADDRIDDYSGGMQRRANIAAGLLHGPHLLILDEPTVGVDPQSRNQILTSIETLGGEGLSVLYTTHYMEEAERLCDRVGILDGGKLIAEGTQHDLVKLVGEDDRILLTGDGDLGGAGKTIGQIGGVAGVSVRPGTVEVQSPNGAAVLSKVVAAAEHHGVVVRGAEVTRPDLESVFLALTGRALRE